MNTLTYIQDYQYIHFQYANYEILPYNDQIKLYIWAIGTQKKFIFTQEEIKDLKIITDSRQIFSFFKKITSNIVKACPLCSQVAPNNASFCPYDGYKLIHKTEWIYPDSTISNSNISNSDDYLTYTTNNTTTDTDFSYHIFSDHNI